MKIQNIPLTKYIADQGHFKEPLYGITHKTESSIDKTVITFKEFKNKIINLEIELQKKEWDAVPLNDPDDIEQFLLDSSLSIEDIEIDI